MTSLFRYSILSKKFGDKYKIICGPVALSSIPFCIQLTNETIKAEETEESVVTDVEVFSDIDIALIVDNMSDDHFLTDEGLHRLEDSHVEIIQGDSVPWMIRCFGVIRNQRQKYLLSP